MLGKILEHKATLVTGIVACIAVAGFGGYYLLKPPARHFTTAVVEPRNISESITASGKVDSDSHVSLSFKKAGTVSSVNVKVGDFVTKGQILASLDAGSIQASLAVAEADVLSAQAGLTSLQKGATPQTRAVYSQNVSTAKFNLSTASQGAYLKARDAITNKIDSLFQNGPSANPTFVPQTDSYQTGLTLSSSRVDLGGSLAAWNAAVSADPLSDAALRQASNTLASTKAFVDLVSSQINRLSPSNSGMTAAQISVYVTTVSAAATEVNSATSDFNSAVQAYNSSVDQANVIEASSTPEAITVAQASVAKAQANVASVASQLQDSRLIAPFDGIVGSVNPKVGEAFEASVPAIDVLSQGNYKIDILIPENEIGAVSVGAPAVVTFDAYGTDLQATATVASVDLSETVTNGVGAYKATVYLNGSNPAIRTGMTGNVSIQGPSAGGVLAVPASAVVSQGGSSFVLARNQSGSYVMRPVTTGISGGGWTEIKSGLAAGDAVAAFGSFAQ